MNNTEFIEFTGLEILVNSRPFYFGGSIKYQEHQAAVLGMIRLHQMNGIGKKLGLPTEKLLKLLIGELQRIHKKSYRKPILLTDTIITKLGYHLKSGSKLKSNYENLIIELALYNLEQKAIILNVQQMFDMAKKNWRIDRPKGSWEIAKHFVVSGKILKSSDGIPYSRGINTELMVWQLEDNPEINIPESSGHLLIALCPDFSSQILTSIKTDIKSWKEKIMIPLGNI